MIQSLVLQSSMSVGYLEGWNMVGLALDVDNANYQTLFSEAFTGALFSYR